MWYKKFHIAASLIASGLNNNFARPTTCWPIMLWVQLHVDPQHRFNYLLNNNYFARPTTCWPITLWVQLYVDPQHMFDYMLNCNFSRPTTCWPITLWVELHVDPQLLFNYMLNCNFSRLTTCWPITLSVQLHVDPQHTFNYMLNYKFARQTAQHIFGFSYMLTLYAMGNYMLTHKISDDNWWNMASREHLYGTTRKNKINNMWCSFRISINGSGHTELL